MIRRTALLLVLPLLLGCGGVERVGPAADRVPAYAEPRPLAGRVVVLDPGHQLGNRNFPRQVGRLVPDGRGGRKACNTTGTATDRGYPEATFVWQVTRLVQRRLERQGATVRLTRTTDSDRRWGPCVDARGRAGNRVHADLKLSVHADGVVTSGRGGARGFHVIVAPDAAAWSARLARAVRAELRGDGLRVATYTAGGDGLDVRTDLATLNLSRIPTAMVELGNMRDPVDAARMTSARGRATYARALAAAVGDVLS